MMRFIIEGNTSALLLQMAVVAVTWVIVLVAMGIDLVFGVKKAKSIGENRSSEGYRRTVKKASYYYATMTFALAMDVLLSVFPFWGAPYITCVAGIFLVFCEYKSVREKADDKQRRKVDTSISTIVKALQESPDALKIMLKLLNDGATDDKGPEEQQPG